MPGPYYGSPHVFLARNKNGRGGLDIAEDVIESCNEEVKIRIESDLISVFESWPAPDGTQKNAVSLLWLYAMTEVYQARIGATARVNMTEYGKAIKTDYETLMERIMSGRAKIPGAVRVSSRPVVGVYASQRIVPHEPQNPVDYIEMQQRGLRR